MDTAHVHKASKRPIFAAIMVDGIPSQMTGGQTRLPDGHEMGFTTNPHNGESGNDWQPAVVENQRSVSGSIASTAGRRAAGRASIGSR